MSTMSLTSTKACTRCGETKPESEYYKQTSRHGKVGLAAECKACSKARAAKWQSENPEKVRLKNRNASRMKIGCTPEQYDEMFSEQNGCCGICRLPFEVLCVDHCHETGRIRGLLCHRCNVSLGGFEDDIERLVRAAEWVT